MRGGSAVASLVAAGAVAWTDSRAGIGAVQLGCECVAAALRRKSSPRTLTPPSPLLFLCLFFPLEFPSRRGGRHGSVEWVGYWTGGWALLFSFFLLTLCDVHLVELR